MGIGYVAYSPLGRGFLTATVTDVETLGPDDRRRAMPRFQSKNMTHNLSLLAILRELAAAEHCTPAQLALAWVLSKREFIVPLPGTKQRRWLEEYAAAASSFGPRPRPWPHSTAPLPARRRRGGPLSRSHDEADRNLMP